MRQYLRIVSAWLPIGVFWATFLPFTLVAMAADLYLTLWDWCERVLMRHIGHPLHRRRRRVLAGGD